MFVRASINRISKRFKRKKNYNPLDSTLDLVKRKDDLDPFCKISSFLTRAASVEVHLQMLNFCFPFVSISSVVCLFFFERWIVRIFLL